MEESAIAGAIFVVLRILEMVITKWRASRVTGNNQNDGLSDKSRSGTVGCVTEQDCERRRNERTSSLEGLERELREEIDKESSKIAQELREFRQSVQQTFEDMYNHGRAIGYDMKFLMGMFEQFNRDRSYGKD